MLGAWVPTAHQLRRPQSHLKENFIQALKSVLKDNISDDAMFKEDWLPMAKDEEKWNPTIGTHFETLNIQNEDITCFEYKPFDRYDLQEEEEEEAENNDTTM